MECYWILDMRNWIILDSCKSRLSFYVSLDKLFCVFWKKSSNNFLVKEFILYLFILYFVNNIWNSIKQFSLITNTETIVVFNSHIRFLFYIVLSPKFIYCYPIQNNFILFYFTLYSLDMVPLLISAIIGFALSEITTHYWKRKHPSKVYFFDRRIHHGEIGVLLLCILSMGKISPLLCSFIIGCGLGLIKDDLQDKSKWFKFQKKSWKIYIYIYI